MKKLLRLLTCIILIISMMTTTVCRAQEHPHKKLYYSFVPIKKDQSNYTRDELRAINPRIPRPEYMQWVADELNGIMDIEFPKGIDGRYSITIKGTMYSLPPFTGGSMDTFWTSTLELFDTVITDTLHMCAIDTNKKVVKAWRVQDLKPKKEKFALLDLANCLGMEAARDLGWSFKYLPASAKCANLISSLYFYCPPPAVPPLVINKPAPYKSPTKDPGEYKYQDEDDDDDATYITNNYYNDYGNNSSGSYGQYYVAGFGVAPYYYGNSYAVQPLAANSYYYSHQSSIQITVNSTTYIEPTTHTHRVVEVTPVNSGPNVINVNPHGPPVVNPGPPVVINTNPHGAPGAGGTTTTRNNPGLNTDTGPLPRGGNSSGENTHIRPSSRNTASNEMPQLQTNGASSSVATIGAGTHVRSERAIAQRNEMVNRVQAAATHVEGRVGREEAYANGNIRSYDNSGRRSSINNRDMAGNNNQRNTSQGRLRNEGRSPEFVNNTNQNRNNGGGRNQSNNFQPGGRSSNQPQPYNNVGVRGGNVSTGGGSRVQMNQPTGRSVATVGGGRR